ncbi:ATP-binding protein [Kitasatospora sp. NPDC057541]|uniref:ATP-binding protein n=1 Tax=unclassified Kitasatospora TaxID=2633591 RepID=UPI0036CECE06
MSVEHHPHDRDEIDDFAMCAAFSCTPRSVGAARRFVEKACFFFGVSAEDFSLLTSEVATNCVTHAGSGFLVSCIGDGAAGIWVQVFDDSRSLPVERRSGVDLMDQSGRGLWLLSELSEWHVTPLKGGKVVCFRPLNQVRPGVAA